MALKFYDKDGSTMIIDFHTHTFPEKIVDKAIKQLSLCANSYNYSNGTDNGLISDMKERGIDYSVVLPVATKPSQSWMLCENAVKMNEITDKTHLIYFGSIHPDNEDYKNIINFLSEHKVKGIKLHPVYCSVPIDDIRTKRIISYASEKDMIVLTHAGFDVGYPSNDYSSVNKITNMLDDVAPTKMVLAHMGGWAQWNQVLDEICGRNVWLDTAFSLLPMKESIYDYNDYPKDKIIHQKSDVLSADMFLKIVKAHGADKILFGSDSPWSSQSELTDYIMNSQLSRAEKTTILSSNAEEILQL